MAHLLTRQGWEKTLQNVSTENSKDKKQKKKTEKIDYPKTVGQVQKVLVNLLCNESTSRWERTEEILEVIMTEKFSKLMSDIKPQIKEVQSSPSKINTK